LSIIACVFSILAIFSYFFITTHFHFGYDKVEKPYFSVVQREKYQFSFKIKTLLFGCANPTFRLCKPYFSVVQTLLFGCAIKIESLNHALLEGVKIAPIYIYIYYY